MHANGLQLVSLPKYDPSLTIDPATVEPGGQVHVATHVSYFYYQKGADPSVPNVYVRYALAGPSGEMPLLPVPDGYTNSQGFHEANIPVPSTLGEYTIMVYVYDLPGGEVWGETYGKLTVKAAAATPTPSTAEVTPVPPIPTPTPTAGSGGFSLEGLGLGNTELLLIAGAVVIVIVLILAVLAILAFVLLRKKLVIVPEKASAPCDGQSTIPICIKFTNGLGRAMRMKADTEVAMEATAGSIQNAIIQNGKDFAETSLTTTKEFGPVTITAKSGNKTAKALVNFTYASAKLDLVLAPASIPADGKSSASIKVKIIDGNGNSIAPLQDLAIELKTTLGKVASRVSMPARTSEATTSITASSASGTAIITAASGPLKGETKLSIENIARRFCMHCGSGMDLEAPNCPKCGLTPPSGVDTKQCSTCGTVIPEAARFCNKCGARQPEKAVGTIQPPPQQPKKE